MRRLSITLAILAIGSVIHIEDAPACKLLKRSSGGCCISRCCQPTACLPTVCGPAREVNTQAVEAMEPPVAMPADDVPAVTVPEAPPAPAPEEAPAAPEEAPPAAEAPPQQPPEEPAVTVEEPAPADDAAPAAQPDSGDDAVKAAPADEAMTDEERMKAFFGGEAEEPETSEESPAPAEEAPKAGAEPPAEGEGKSALDDFFSIQTRQSSFGVAFAGTSDFRTWRDISGQYEIEAKFVACFDDGTIRLEKSNGRWVRLPFAQLSQADQLFTRQVFASETMIAMTSK